MATRYKYKIYFSSGNITEIDTTAEAAKALEKKLHWDQAFWIETNPGSSYINSKLIELIYKTTYKEEK